MIMAKKSISDETIERVLIDWRLGAYSVRQLADKHSISSGAAGNIVKGKPKDLVAVVDAGIQYRQGIAAHCGQSQLAVHAVESAVDEHTRDMAVINALAMKIAQKASMMLDSAESTGDLRNIGAAVKDIKEVRFGKQSDTAIQINNSAENVTSGAKDLLMARLLKRGMVD